MKTVVTVIHTEQVSMEEFRDFKTSKIFTDSSTIGEIKEWVIKERKINMKIENFGFSGIDFSDLKDEQP